MNVEKPTNTIEEKSNYEFLKNEIENVVLSTPKFKDKKTHLLEILNMDYGIDLSKKIIESLPSNYFDNIEETKKEIPPMVSEEKNETVLEDTLKKDFNLPDDKIKEIKKDPRIKKILKIGIFSALAVASIVGILKASDFKKGKKESNLDKKEKDVIKEENNLDKTISFNKRFKGEVYATLSKEGGGVYKYMAEENPTPGRWYQLLEKDSALIYIFNQQNELVAKIVAGFGKEEGDTENTSEELDRGTQTTPAGVCLFSNFTTEEDLVSYGKLQFSLIGKSVLGDIINLGQHQTYPDEIEPRTKKLNTKTPDDNKFSNGCINISVTDFEKYIKPNFKGDYGEFMFILQDKKGRDSGVKFDAKELVQSVIPMMIEMTNEDMNMYSNSITETKNSIRRINEEIVIMESEYNKLVKEYKQNKNVNTQAKIEKIKDGINNKKNEVSQLRKLLTIYANKVKGVTVKRDQVEKILMEME